jgi:hypothetical protein
MGPLADVLEAVAGSPEGLARSTYDRLEKLCLALC